MSLKELFSVLVEVRFIYIIKLSTIDHAWTKDESKKKKKHSFWLYISNLFECYIECINH